MRAQCRRRPMNQSPQAANPSGQQSRVLVLRLHDDPIPIKTLKVLGQRKGDSWTTPCKRGIRHRELLEFGNVCDARIFDAPNLLRILPWTYRHRRFRIDPPAVDSIRRARGAKVG